MPHGQEQDFINLDTLFLRGRRRPIEAPPMRPLRPGFGLPPEEPRFDPKYPGTEDAPRQQRNRPIDRNWRGPKPQQWPVVVNATDAPDMFRVPRTTDEYFQAMAHNAALSAGMPWSSPAAQQEGLPAGGWEWADQVAKALSGALAMRGGVGAPLRPLESKQGGDVFFRDIPKRVRGNLEQVVDFLTQKIKNWPDIAGQESVRVGTGKLPGKEGTIAFPSRRRPWPLKRLFPWGMTLSEETMQDVPKGAEALLHEMLHIPVANLRMRGSPRAEFVSPIQKLANVASQRLPLSERLQLGMGYPQKDPNYLNELVTNYLTSNVAAKRLGIPRKTDLRAKSLPYRPGMRVPPGRIEMQKELGF